MFFWLGQVLRLLKVWLHLCNIMYGLSSFLKIFLAWSGGGKPHLKRFLRFTHWEWTFENVSGLYRTDVSVYIWQFLWIGYKVYAEDFCRISLAGRGMCLASHIRAAPRVYSKKSMYLAKMMPSTRAIHSKVVEELHPRKTLPFFFQKTSTHPYENQHAVRRYFFKFSQFSTLIC